MTVNKIKSEIITSDNEYSVTRTEETTEEIFKRAQLCKRNLELADAAEQFLKVIEKDPDHGWAHHCVAQIYHWSGELDKSIEHYIQASDCLSFKTSSVSLHQLAKLYDGMGEDHKAYITIKEASTRNSDNIDIENDKKYICNKLINLVSEYIDPIYYIDKINSLSGKKNCNLSLFSAYKCAEHYIDLGWVQFPEGNWLFSRKYIEYQYSEYSSASPLILQYLSALNAGKKINPTPLISIEYLASTDASLNVEGVIKDLIAGRNIDNTYSNLFDPQYYSIQYDALDIHDAEAIENPYKHYLTVGCKTDADPHRLFDTSFYRSQFSYKLENPLEHYFTQSVSADESPCLTIDTRHYLEQFPIALESREPLLVHFLKSKDRRKSIAGFSASNYLADNKDIQGLCPYKHFAEHGITEVNRKPFTGFSQNYIYRKMPVTKRGYRSPVKKYYLNKPYKNKSILVVSHSGSRTGAPLIILNIVKELSSIDNINLVTIVIGGGELVPEFEKYSHVLTTKNVYGANQKENKSILEIVNILDIGFVIANSSESMKFVSNNNISKYPVFSLIHESADHYPQNEWKTIFDLSDKVIFPSEFIIDKSNEKLSGVVDLEECKQKVAKIPQGLLTARFGQSNREKNRVEARKKYGIDADTTVVLGCGTVDFRKGVDLFYDTAIDVIENSKNEKVVFIWIGASPTLSDNNNILYWKIKSTKTEISECIKFVDPVDDPQAVFQCADIFLLSSRSDPFPCVVHEALSCGLPIVYMKNATGSEELITDRFGIPSTYESVSELSNSIRTLIDDFERRNKLGTSGQHYVNENCQFKDYVAELCNYFVDSELLSSDINDVLNNYTRNIDKEDLEKTAVYFLSPDWGLSGVNSITEVLIRELNFADYDAKMLFTRHDLDFSHSEEVILPTVPFEFLNPGTDEVFPKNVWDALIRKFEQHEPCIVVVNYDYIASSISALLPDHICVIGVAHSDDAEHYEHVSRVGVYWNHVIGVSETITNRIKEINPSLSNVTPIRNGIEIDTENSVKKKEFGKPIKLVYSGRMVDQQKKVSRYIELAKELDRKKIDYKMELLGDGDQIPVLQKLIAQNNLGERVKQFGRVSNSRSIEIINEADIFVLFSDFEGLPISLLESLRAGCVPIVFDMNSGINDVIEHRVNGFICNTNTVKEAANYIVELVEMDDKSSLVEACSESLQLNELTSQHMAKSYIKIFNDEIEKVRSGKYTRPKSLEHGYWYKGALPPAWVQKEQIEF